MLSEPSFSERKKIITAALHAFGNDDDRNNQFNYEDRTRRAFDLADRKWVTEAMVIELKEFELFRKYALVITLPEIAVDGI